MDFLKREIVSINAAAFLIGAAGLISRILGLFRDRLLAGHFGASRELDIYYAAFQIPDFIFTLFLIGAAGSAIIPIFLAYAEKDKKEAEELVNSLINLILILTLIFSLIIFFAAPFIIDYLVPGFGMEEKELTVNLTGIMMLSPFFFSVSNIISSVAQAHRRFAAFALSSVFYNIGIILGIIFLLPEFGLQGIAYGVVLGSFLHLAVQLPVFSGLGFRVRPVFSIHPGIKRIMFLSAPRVISVSLASITLIFINALASRFSAGSITVFKLAENIQFIPIGIVGVSFAVAVFPRLSESFIKKNAEVFYSSFFGTFRAVVFWLAPLTVFFYVLRSHIIRLALGTGLFDWRDTRLTAAVLGIFSLAILTQSLVYLLIRSFYAMNKTAKPLLINVLAAVFTVILSLVLSDVFSGSGSAAAEIVSSILKVEDIKDVSVLGLALAFVLGQLLNFLLLFRLFFKESGKIFGAVPARGITREMSVILGAAAAAGLVVYFFRLLLGFMNLDTFSGVFVQGALSGLAGVIFYSFVLYKMNNAELFEVIEVFRRRLMKISILPQQLENLDK